MRRHGPEGFIGLLGCVDMHATRLGMKPDPEEVEGFVMKFLDAVQDLRAEGIVWTDLHSGNVTSDDAGDPVILDIGPYAVAEQEDDEIPLLAGVSSRVFAGV